MTPRSPLPIREASAADVERVLGWTHGLWGARLPLDAYTARTVALMQTPWAQAHYRFVVGLGPDGRPVTACKRYQLALARDGEPVAGVGFGAVFTPESERGRGYAAALLGAVMAEEAARGARVAILFSDIGAPYYERLGFRALGTLRGSAAPTAGPSGFRPATPLEAERCPAWLEALADRRLAARHDAPHWHYLLARNGPSLWAYAPAGEARGFIAGRVAAGQLWVAAAGHGPDVDPAAFWTAVRCLAGELALNEVAGWLPARLEAVGFAFTPVTAGLPMAAQLDSHPPIEGVAWWELDHF